MSTMQIPNFYVALEHAMIRPRFNTKNSNDSIETTLDELANNYDALINVGLLTYVHLKPANGRPTVTGRALLESNAVFLASLATGSNQEDIRRYLLTDGRLTITVYENGVYEELKRSLDK